MGETKTRGAMVCEFCESPMVGRRRRFCNFECRQRAEYQRARGRPAGCWGLRTCRGCGAVLGGQRWAWCSESCRAAGKRKPGVVPKARHDLCRECAASIRHLQGGAVFCTPRCSRRYRKRLARAAVKARKAAAAATSAAP